VCQKGRLEIGGGVSAGLVRVCVGDRWDPEGSSLGRGGRWVSRRGQVLSMACSLVRVPVGIEYRWAIASRSC
jgi:hypothetical protein